MKTRILIPSHGLEDFPTELGDAEAAGLLNAFAVAFHPRVLAASDNLPGWQRADVEPDDVRETLFLLPHCSEEWLPHGWAESARQNGATVVESGSDRANMVRELEAALSELPAESELAGQFASGTTGDPHAPTLREPSAPAEPAELDADLLADFLAFGSAYLQVELLTRRMHYYSNLDSGPLWGEISSAAGHALAGDAEQARRKLCRAFELLLDARERFFPVDAYLIDLCLVVPHVAEELAGVLSPLQPTTLLATAADWSEIAKTRPALIEQIGRDWAAGRRALVGGERRELPIALLPIEGVLREFRDGLATYKRLFGKIPRVWARRRFGLTALLPRILNHADLPFALHVALDDGIYPDDEASKLRWEGAGGVSVDAFSRIPLAAASATSFLRFAQRMAESMEEDIAAAAMFAHWPEVSTPWFEDFQRIAKYAPVLGRFATLETFFEETEPPGRVFQHDSTGYFPPYLTQSVARENPDPIRRFAALITNQEGLDQAAWLLSAARLLGVGDETLAASAKRLEDLDEQFGEAAGTDDGDGSFDDAALAVLRDETAGFLAERLLTGAPRQTGLLVVNPLSFPRRSSIAWPAGWPLPTVEGAVLHTQAGPAGGHVTLELSGSGFQWLPRPGADAPPPADEPPTATGHVLRNEFFEVHVSEATGGIAFIKGYGRSPKRLSQQLALRFPRARKVAEGGWGDEDSYYSAMRCTSLAITSRGPAFGEIATKGELIDQTDSSRLARFEQTIRVWRGRRDIELEIALEPERLPEGDPWTNYYACRFAWNDETAVLTRDLHGIAQPAPQGRFDAGHYIEIAEDERRTTIVPRDAPFHRRTGERMLDSLLVVAGERSRRFRFSIFCDQAYPLRAALNARCEPVCLETAAGPPSAGTAGWFWRVDAKNVQVTSVRDVSKGEGAPVLAVTLMETEGRGRLARLACCREPKTARIVDLGGATMADLSVEEGAVLVDLGPFEIATVHLEF